MSHVKVVSKRLLYDTKFLKLSEVKLKLPNKKIKKHYNVERVPTVSVFPITPNFDIYLISHYRYLYDKVLLEAVAGTVLQGEEFLDAAKRELKEEAGIAAKKWRKLATIDLAGSYIKATVTLFLASGLTIGKASPDEDERIAVVCMPLTEAVEKVMRGEITTASSIVGILMLDRMRREGKL